MRLAAASRALGACRSGVNADLSPSELGPREHFYRVACRGHIDVIAKGDPARTTSRVGEQTHIALERSHLHKGCVAAGLEARGMECGSHIVETRAETRVARIGSAQLPGKRKGNKGACTRSSWSSF